MVRPYGQGVKLAIPAILALVFARRLGKRPGWIIIANGFLMSALTFAYAASTSVVVAVLVSSRGDMGGDP